MIPRNEQKECPGCAVMIEGDADVCPICGYEFPKQSMGMQIIVWVMIILLLLFWVVW